MRTIQPKEYLYSKTIPVLLSVPLSWGFLWSTGLFTLIVPSTVLLWMIVPLDPETATRRLSKSAMPIEPVKLNSRLKLSICSLSLQIPTTEGSIVWKCTISWKELFNFWLALSQSKGKEGESCDIHESKTRLCYLCRVAVIRKSHLQESLNHTM